jgi:hypothetical protein
MRFLNKDFKDANSKQLWERFYPEHPKDLSRHVDDPFNTYEMNEMGHRGKNMTYGHELVVSGCSVTWGLGVPEEAIWGNFLAKMMGYDSYTNLGHRAGSVQSIVYSLMAYIHKHGKPKHIFCLFPDPYRFLYAEVKGFNRTEHSLDTSLANVFLRPSWADPIAPYSKAPHALEEVVAGEMAVFHSAQVIHMFTDYCKAAGINFWWSTYNSDMYDLIKLNNYEPMFAKYVDYKTEFPDAKQDCHHELRDRHEHCFYIGSDVYLTGGSHIGVHDHVHIAEKFFEVHKKHLK